MKCPYCDSNIKKSKFCSECGKELDSGLSEEQKKYLKRKKTGHTINAVSGGIIAGLGIPGGIILLILGILLSLTIIGAIIGIPMIIFGIFALTAGSIGVGAATHSGKKVEELDDQLHGIKK
jgi:uncharacterized membrane protein